MWFIYLVITAVYETVYLENVGCHCLIYVVSLLLLGSQTTMNFHSEFASVNIVVLSEWSCTASSVQAKLKSEFTVYTTICNLRLQTLIGLYCYHCLYTVMFPLWVFSIMFFCLSPYLKLWVMPDKFWLICLCCSCSSAGIVSILVDFLLLVFSNDLLHIVTE